MLNKGLVIGLIQKYAPVASPEVIAQAVDDYLEQHPEITVADGSITEAKLAEEVANQLEEIPGIKNALTAMDTATASDVGKALSPKTVVNGKVTEWKFVESGGSVDPQDIEEAVSNVIEEHPEWVTTVQDGSISKAKLDADLQSSFFNDVYEQKSITETTGKYYKLTGQYSTFNNARHSQPIPVKAGKKVKVTGKSQANIASVLFFNSNEPSATSFVAYDCYTGQTVTFTNEEVTVPTGATYAVVQSISTDIALQVQVSENKIDTINDELTANEDDKKYFESVMCNRLMAMGKTSHFSWGTFPSVILTIRCDDLRADIDLVAKIVTGEYNLPLLVAACAKEINKSVTGIVDPAEKIGDTRLEVCQWVQEHGGEIAVHPDETITSGDYETSIKPYLLDSKRTFEDNGIKIRGAAVANSNPSAAVAKMIDPYMYGFYDYSDGYGTIAPYTFDGVEKASIKFLNDFSSDATAFETWLNNRTALTGKNWYTLVLHQIGTDVTETAFRDMLDVIQTNVSQGKVAVMCWGEVFDTYGQH